VLLMLTTEIGRWRREWDCESLTSLSSFDHGHFFVSLSQKTMQYQHILYLVRNPAVVFLSASELLADLVLIAVYAFYSLYRYPWESYHYAEPPYYSSHCL
jgi:hypothetical protein